MHKDLPVRETRWLLGFILWMGLCLLGCSTAETTPVFQPRNIEISTPKEHPVGQPLRISAVADSVPDATPGRLMLLGSYGMWIYESAFESGEIVFDIPAQETEQAGWVTAVINISGTTQRQRFELLAGEAVDPLTPLVGPRTITANGKTWSIATVIPFDRYANPIADGTATTFRIAHPGDINETFEIATQNLLAWLRVTSKTRSGKTFISAQVDDAFGKETEILQTADWPVPFTITNEPKEVVADGQQLTQLRTSRIVDQNGNVMPDGTLVQFVVEDGDGYRRVLPAKTVDGFAKIPLQAPLRPTDLTVVGSVFAIESQPLTINFKPGPAIGSFPIVMGQGAQQYNGYLTFTAGPLLGERDQYIPDGTPILFRLEHETGTVHEERIVSEDGYALFAMRKEQFLTGNYTIYAYVGNGEGRLTFAFKK